MRYQDPKTGGQNGYPNHDIDPRLKKAEWCMQYAKAAYNDWCSLPKGVFSNNQGDYEKFRMYAMGKQPITPYKKWLGVEEATNNTWLSVDWTVRSIVSPYRDKAISRLMAQERDIIATPIDMQAKAEWDQFYSQTKAKLIVRDLMAKENPELANHPMIMTLSGEPMDVEELEMRVEMGEQFMRAKDAEQAIALGFYENNYTLMRRAIYEDLFDYGVAGYKEWLGDDNKAKCRKVNPEAVITSTTSKPDFSDIVHAGEAIDVSLVELATKCDAEGNAIFTDEELQEFAGTIAGKWGNPKTLGGLMKPYDKFKCQVLDIEFFSYDTHVYRDTQDEYGNPDFRKAEYGRGKTSEKYKRKKIQVVYKCKWVIGTDKCYDWGLATDPKRANDPKKKAKTSLSYKFIAYNFYEMKAQGFMERLIPYLDEYQLTMLKIQNFKNRAVPSGWWINLDALENVALSKGGAAMQPKELLKMFFETGVLVGRSLDSQGTPMFQNTQPVIPIENTAASELQMFYGDLVNIIMAIERITGYNAPTMGEANPKMLVPGYELAAQSTNDALQPMAWAEKYLSEQLAQDVLVRMQQGLRKGGVEGYAPALNSNTLQFLKLSPELSLRDYGIITEAKMDNEQKAWLYQMMQGDIANGFLDTSDAVLIVNTFNSKMAQTLWSYRVKKAKQRMQEYELQKIELNNQGASQAAQLAAQEKERQIQLEIQGRLQEKAMILQAEIIKEQNKLSHEREMKMLEMGVKREMNTENNQTKLVEAGVAADAKVESQKISSEGDIEKAEISGEMAIEKQKISNKKPTTPSKK